VDQVVEVLVDILLDLEVVQIKEHLVEIQEDILQEVVEVEAVLLLDQAELLQLLVEMELVQILQEHLLYVQVVAAEDDQTEAE
jgi:hypothetical protein